MIVFLLILCDNFWAEEFKQAAFNKITWLASGAWFDVNLVLFDLPIGSESYPWIFLKNQVKLSVYVYVVSPTNYPGVCSLFL